MEIEITESDLRRRNCSLILMLVYLIFRSISCLGKWGRGEEGAYLLLWGVDTYFNKNSTCSFMVVYSSNDFHLICELASLLMLSISCPLDCNSRCSSPTLFLTWLISPSSSLIWHCLSSISRFKSSISF